MESPQETLEECNAALFKLIKLFLKTQIYS